MYEKMSVKLIELKIMQSLLAFFAGPALKKAKTEEPQIDPSILEKIGEHPLHKSRLDTQPNEGLLTIYNAFMLKGIKAKNRLRHSQTNMKYRISSPYRK